MKKRISSKLQHVMLSLASLVMVLAMANVSHAALQCYNCHGNNTNDMRPIDTPAGSPSSFRNVSTGALKGNHMTHVAATPAAAACTKCHNNSGYISSHRNGGIDMAANINTSPATGVYGSKGVFFNQTSVPTLQTCSNVNCHFEAVTPTWGSNPAATNCDSCHSSVPTTLSHSAHTAQYGGTASCVKCHADHTASFQHATSAGRPINLSQTGGSYNGSNNKYLPSQTGRLVGQCSTTYCHSSGQSFNGTSATPYTYATPVWGNSGDGTCGTCHVTNLLNTGTHANHLAKDQNCGSCHNGATVATMTATTHVDGFINVSGSLNVKYSQGRSSIRGNGYGTCNNASCHAPFTNATPLTTPTWGVTSASCSYCHQGSPSTGAHTKHLAIPAVAGLPQSCDYCHTAVTSLSAATHVNGSINFVPGLMPAAPLAKHDAGDANYTATCTASCHTPFTGTGTTPNWGQVTAPTNHSCNVCHEVRPTTGVHTRHLNATAVVSGCATCHAGTVENSNNGGATHSNNVIDVIQMSGGQTAKHAAGNANYSATCTTSCHNPYSTSAGVTTPNWGVTASACSSCHNSSTAAFDGTGNGPQTGSHNNHMTHTTVSCSNCHVGVVANTNGGTNHLSGYVNVSSSGTGKAQITKHASGSGYMSCTATCHNGSEFTAPAVTWGASLTCASCHAYPPATAGHAAVNPATPGACSSCHSEVSTNTIVTTPVASAFVDRQLHMNGKLDGGSCDACHGYPPVQSMAGVGVNGSYSSAKLENYSGGGGVHNVAGHLLASLKSSQGSTFTPCLTCHPSSLHNQGFGQFSTHNVQVVVDPKFKFDKNHQIVYSGKQTGTKTTGTCTNVSCHFQPTPPWSNEAYTQRH
ncbi:MAG: CxxxxCH/CxxCH domain-containing protein [Desulfobacteraceae bacterium]|nr:CxxxxCH/CxxCH domain-containing protein [Desulfobacteraceae bacterium]